MYVSLMIFHNTDYTKQPGPLLSTNYIHHTGNAFPSLFQCNRSYHIKVVILYFV